MPDLEIEEQWIFDLGTMQRTSGTLLDVLRGFLKDTGIGNGFPIPVFGEGDSKFDTLKYRAECFQSVNVTLIPLRFDVVGDFGGRLVITFRARSCHSACKDAYANLFSELFRNQRVQEKEPQVFLLDDKLCGVDSAHRDESNQQTVLWIDGKPFSVTDLQVELPKTDRKSEVALTLESTSATFEMKIVDGVKLKADECKNKKPRMTWTKRWRKARQWTAWVWHSFWHRRKEMEMPPSDCLWCEQRFMQSERYSELRPFIKRLQELSESSGGAKVKT